MFYLYDFQYFFFFFDGLYMQCNSWLRTSLNSRHILISRHFNFLDNKCIWIPPWGLLYRGFTKVNLLIPRRRSFRNIHIHIILQYHVEILFSNFVRRFNFFFVIFTFVWIRYNKKIKFLKTIVDLVESKTTNMRKK